MRSGSYYWDSTGLSNRGSNGYYWTLRSGTTTSSSYLNFNSSDLDRRNINARGSGFAVHSRDYGLLSAPLSYVRSGDYYWASSLNNRGTDGYYWSRASRSNTSSGNQTHRSNYLEPKSVNSHGYGLAMRCVSLLPSRDYGLLSAPLSYVRSGYYYWGSTGLNGRGSGGSYWSLRSDSTASSYNLNFNSSGLSPQYGGNRGYGFAVRCMPLSTRDFGLLSAPLSYVRSGDYAWDSTGLVNRGSRGYYWSLRPGNTTSSNYLSFDSSYLGPQRSDSRGDGFAVRCLSK